MSGATNRNSDINTTLRNINSTINYIYRQFSTPEYNTDSAYIVATSLETPNVNPGDQIKINIFLSGYGIPERNKLAIIITQPNIIEKSDVGKIITPVISTNEGIISGKLAVWHKNMTQFDIDRGGGTANLVNAYFVPQPNAEWIPSALPPILAEQVHGGLSPVEVKCNVSDTAKSGNYKINVIFTYQSNNQIKQSSSEVEVHVNDRREQLEPWVTRVVIAGVVIALISLFFEAGLF